MSNALSRRHPTARLPIAPAAASRGAPAFCAIAVLLLAIFGPSRSALAAARTWNNTGTDFNTTGNWTGGTPGTNDVALFGTAQAMQPSVSVSLTLAGLRFSGGATGYNIANTGGAALTLNGVNTTGTSGTTTASGSAVRNDNTTGVTTIDVPLTLAPSTLISTMFQEAADGSTLILNGAIGQTGTVALSLKNGTFQLNASNSYGGGTSVDAAGTTLVIGNDGGLGSGPLTINNTSSLQAGGGSRLISNRVTMSADTTIGGSNDLTFGSPGAFTIAGAINRILTVNNSGSTTLAGNVFLSDLTGTGRTLRIDGAGAVTVSGVIANFDGVGTAGNLTYAGTNTLTLTNTNTYSGTTSVINGKVLVTGSISGSTLSVAAGSANTAILAASGANNLIAPTASSGNAVTIGSLSIGSTSRLAPGDVGSVGSMNFTLQGTAQVAFAANSQLHFDISTAVADKVVFSAPPAVGEWVTRTGAAALLLNGTIDYNQTYLVFQNAIASSATGGFTFASITGFDNANYAASFGQSGNDYVLSFTSIPEPSVLLALFTGTGILLGCRRGRHRPKKWLPM